MAIPAFATADATITTTIAAHRWSSVLQNARKNHHRSWDSLQRLPASPALKAAACSHLLQGHSYGWHSSGRFPWRTANTNMHGLLNRRTGPSGPPGKCRKDEAQRIDFTAYSCGVGFFAFAGGRGELDSLPGDRTWHLGHRIQDHIERRRAEPLYSLRYTEEVCDSVSHISFKYHMWLKARELPGRESMALGTLHIRTAEGAVVWEVVGTQEDAWLDVTVVIRSRGFSFEYLSAEGWGEPAIANVVLWCAFAPPPSPPFTPPSPQPPPSLPSPPAPPPSPPLPSPPPAPPAVHIRMWAFFRHVLANQQLVKQLVYMSAAVVGVAMLTVVVARRCMPKPRVTRFRSNGKGSYEVV